MRRVATPLLVCVGVLAAAGTGLAVRSLLHRHHPFLDTGEQVLLVLHWSAIGAITGLGPGLVAATIGLLLPRTRQRVAVAFVLAAVVLVAAALLARQEPPLREAFAPASLPPVAAAPVAHLPSRADVAVPPMGAASSAPPNIVLYTIDTLRADHVRAYGYARDTTPHLDRLAREGTLFESAIAHAPATLRSMTALLTGIHPPAFDRDHAARGGEGAFVSEPVRTLAERLRDAGYDTAGFVTNSYLDDANGFGQGFAAWDDAAAGRLREHHAREVVDPAIAWLARAKPPFFLWVHVLDPHHPYEPEAPAAWEETATPRFAALEAAYHARSVDEYTERVDGYGHDRLEFEPGELDFLVGRYDAEIRQADAELGRLLAALERGGHAARTWVVVTSDHGEEFEDHGGMLHALTLYDEMLRVPLVMRGPGVAAGRRVRAQVRLVDVAPTLLARAGAESDGLDGASLEAHLAAGTEPASRPALSVRGTKYLSYRTPEWKLVVGYEPYLEDPVAWSPRGFVELVEIALHRERRPKIGLFHLAEDPGEERDRMGRAAGPARALYQALRREQEAALRRAPSGPAGPGLTPAQQAQLRALGYVD